LAFFVEDGWRRCCERSIELLHYGGLGHSLAIHSNDEHVIQRFFEDKPAFRILVNTTSSLGAVGYTTGLAPAMTLGPGTWAGSSTSDNITPLHLINIKRLAREVRSYKSPVAAANDSTGSGSGELANSAAPSEVQRAVEAFLSERRERNR
jgi:acetaldehyde dehydrogenase (acetylating)